MEFYWLVLGTLGTWRLTHLVALEEGPLALFEKLRRRAGPSILGQVLDCFYCLSLWSAAIVALPLAKGALHYIYLCLAFSAGAILLESLAHRGGNPEPVCDAKPVVLGGPLDPVATAPRTSEAREGGRGGFRHAHGFGD